MNLRVSTFVACGFLIAAASRAENPGSLIKAADLKARPFIDAEAVARLADNAPIVVVGYQGAWTQVQTADGKEGWVRLLNVRLGDPAKKIDVGKTVKQIGGVFRTGTTKAAATTGVKGLSKEDIKNSTPNPDEVRRLDDYRAAAGEISQFASNHHLAAQDVPELKP